jgi:hypothetical protein
MDKPRPVWREKGQDYVIGYMCLIDFECELGAAQGGNRIFPSVEECREHRKCVGSCGIVKVKVEAIEIVQEPDGSCKSC